MAIAIRWADITQTVLVIIVEGVWTLEDYYRGFQKATELINQAGHDVTLILDMTRSHTAPARFLSTGRFWQEHRSEHLTLIVGASPLIYALAGLMKKLYPEQCERMRFVATLDEAYQIAQQRAVAAAAAGAHYTGRP